MNNNPISIAVKKSISPRLESMCNALKISMDTMLKNKGVFPPEVAATIAELRLRAVEIKQWFEVEANKWP